MKATMKAPKLLSEAILMALEDQLKAEKHPEILVDMGMYHDPFMECNSQMCYMCFAGALMHYRFNADLAKKLMPNNFTDAWSRVFVALDLVREGCVGEALAQMRVPKRKWEKVGSYYDVQLYDIDRVAFRRQMRRIVKRLQKVGL